MSFLGSFNQYLCSWPDFLPAKSSGEHIIFIYLNQISLKCVLNCVCSIWIDKDIPSPKSSFWSTLLSRWKITCRHRGKEYDVSSIIRDLHRQRRKGVVSCVYRLFSDAFFDFPKQNHHYLFPIPGGYTFRIPWII